MKNLLMVFLIFSALLSFENKAFSLTDYQIRKICQKARRQSACIQNLKYKRFNLMKGNIIEIPVIPHKR